MQWRYNVIKVHSSTDDFSLLTFFIQIILMFSKTNMAENTFCKTKKASEYDQEIPETHTVGQPQHNTEEPQNTYSQKTSG